MKHNPFGELPKTDTSMIERLNTLFAKQKDEKEVVSDAPVSLVSTFYVNNSDDNTSPAEKYTIDANQFIVNDIIPVSFNTSPSIVLPLTFSKSSSAGIGASEIDCEKIDKTQLLQMIKSMTTYVAGLIESDSLDTDTSAFNAMVQAVNELHSGLNAKNVTESDQSAKFADIETSNAISKLFSE